MSPEQAEGRRDVDWRTDLWALGVIIHECLTGHNPYIEETLGRILVKIIKEDVPPPSTLAPVPVGFDAWFARANRKEKELRFQSAKEMTEAFRQLKGEPLASSVPGAVAANTAPGEPHARPGTTTMGVAANSVSGKTSSSNSTGRYVILGAAALALLAGGGWLAMRGGAADKPVEAEPSVHPAAAVEPPPAVHTVDAPVPAPVEQATPPAAAPSPSLNAVLTPAAAAKPAPLAPTGLPAKKSAPPASSAKPAAAAPAKAQPASSPAPAPAAPAAPAAPFNPLQQRF
jgi:serine/threonine-protein kinase